MTKAKGLPTIKQVNAALASLEIEAGLVTKGRSCVSVDSISPSSKQKLVSFLRKQGFIFKPFFDGGLGVGSLFIKTHGTRLSLF